MEPLIGETGCSSLPTPMTDSGRQSGKCRDFGGDLLHGVTCENCKVVTLPTPTARDHKDTTVRMEPHRPNDTDTINRALASITTTATEWGKYEPAIRRWESLTRPVPEPTVPHKEKRRLNPVFVEWMMGLPAGHVTGQELSSAKELKMLGNGVVPQQARIAVKQLLARIDRNESRQLEGGVL